MSKDRRIDQYDGSLSLVHGFQRLKPVGRAAAMPLVPRRVRYMYVDKLYDDGSRLSQALFKDAGLGTLKYESVESSICSPKLVVVTCSVKRKELAPFVEAMCLRDQILRSEVEVAGYADFCIGLHLGALKQRQEVPNENHSD